jgi:Fur family ferric uptake transcriptional regulator
MILRRELFVAATSKRTHRRRPSGAIERACREHGLRMTGQRRLIARILDEAEDHPDVVELHRRAVGVDSRISLSTVYRTVKLLETERIIERLDFRDSRSRYEQATREHHDHLINLETGAVIEFRSEEIEALQTEIARRLGYRLVYHRLELYAVPLDQGDE